LKYHGLRLVTMALAGFSLVSCSNLPSSSSQPGVVGSPDNPTAAESYDRSYFGSAFFSKTSDSGDIYFDESKGRFVFDGKTLPSVNEMSASYAQARASAYGHRVSMREKEGQVDANYQGEPDYTENFKRARGESAHPRKRSYIPLNEVVAQKVRSSQGWLPPVEDHR